MSDKLCLQWNDFQKNVANAFRNLRKDNEFADLTLVCEDGNQIEVHKMVLSSSSPFFKTLLAKNKHPHPMVYMRGIKSGDLSAVVDFLYHGEAKVFEEDLDSFLTIAEEFQLMGLMKEPDEKVFGGKEDQNESFASVLFEVSRDDVAVNVRDEIHPKIEVENSVNELEKESDL